MKKIFFVIIIINISIASFSSTKWMGILDSGMEDFRKGQYNFAVTNLKKYLLLSGNDINKPKALYYLSLSYYFENNFSQAKINLDELISRYKTSEFGIQAYFWLGLINQNEKEWKNAEELFLRFIYSMPGSDLLDRAHLAVANCQYEQSKHKEALETLGVIVTNEKSEKFEEASVLYSYILIKLNDIENGISFLSKWVTRIEENPNKYLLKDRLWLYLAELYININEDKKAYILLKNIDNFSPGSLSSDIALLRLSEIEFRSGNTLVSAEYIKRLNIEYPDSIYNIDAQLNSGIALFSEKKYSKSTEAFGSVIKNIDRKIAETISSDEKNRLISLKSKTILYYAESLINLKRTSEAIELLNNIITNSYPNFEEAILMICELYIEENEIKALENIINKYESTMVNSSKKERFDIIIATSLSNNKKHSESNKKIEYITNQSKNYSAANSLRINNYIALSQTEQALKTLQEQLSISPKKERAQITYNMMSLNFNNGNYTEVIRISEIMPTYLKELSFSMQLSISLKTDYLMGLCYMQIKEYNKGISLLNKIITLRDDKTIPDNDRKLIENSFYYIAWMYYKISDYKNAAIHFKTASLLIKNPELKTDSQFMEAWSYYSAGNYSDAAKQFITIYEIYKSGNLAVKSLLNAGKSFQNINKNKEALDIFNRIYTEFTDSEYRPDALYELIKYAYNDKKDIEANRYIHVFSDNYQKNPLYPSILMLQMENFLSAERYSEVLSASLHFINTIPDATQYDMIYYWAGLSSFKIKDFDTSEKYFLLVTEQFNNSTFNEIALKNLINIYNETRQYTKEIATITKFLATFKDDENYKTRLLVLNKMSTGVSIDEASLQTSSDTGDLNARYKLAVFLYNKGDIEKSTQLLSEMREKDKGINGALANNFLGDIEFKKENYKGSLVIYANSISKFAGDNETNAEALYKTAYCYYTLNSKEQALKLLQTLNEKYPENKWKPNAEALMRSLK